MERKKLKKAGSKILAIFIWSEVKWEKGFGMENCEDERSEVRALIIKLNTKTFRLNP